MADLAFKTRNIDQYSQSLAQYLPGDKQFRAKNIKAGNLRKFITGLADTLFDVNGYIKGFTDDISPLVTEKFISEWEFALGIPDDCFFISGKTNAERRVYIIAKLSYMAVQTGVDIEDLALWLGFVVIVYAGIDDPTGATSGLSDTEKRFTVVIDTSIEGDAVFPLTFPIVFGNPDAILLQCVIDQVIPSNCQALYNFI